MIYEHILDVDTSIDGIIIWSPTKEEHDHRLQEVLKSETEY